MPRFTVTRSHLGAQELIVLVDADADREVRIARRGATVLSIGSCWGDKRRNIADGFRDEKELVGHKGSRFAIMTPFANRVDDSRYTFEGKTYDLQPGAVGADRASRHGFLRGVLFDVQREHADDDKASITLVTQAIRPDVNPGYPFALDFSVTFTLGRRRPHGGSEDAQRGRPRRTDLLRLAPVLPPVRQPDRRLGVARAGGQGDRHRQGLHPAARHECVAGHRARRSRARLPHDAEAIGDVQLNHTYADLQLDADGRARTRLRDPKSGVAIAVWQEKGVMLVFTADTTDRDARKSVALEPMECMPNAFNRDDCTPLITLGPGQERRFVCGVEFDQ